QERALSRAIGTAQAEELADRHMERDVVEDDLVAETFYDVADVENAWRVFGRKRPAERWGAFDGLSRCRTEPHASRWQASLGRPDAAHLRCFSSCATSKRMIFSYESVSGPPPTGSRTPRGIFASSASTFAGRGSSCGSLKRAGTFFALIAAS